MGKTWKYGHIFRAGDVLEVTERADGGKVPLYFEVDDDGHEHSDDSGYIGAIEYRINRLTTGVDNGMGQHWFADCSQYRVRVVSRDGRMCCSTLPEWLTDEELSGRRVHLGEIDFLYDKGGMAVAMRCLTCFRILDVDLFDTGEYPARWKKDCRECLDSS